MILNSSVIYTFVSETTKIFNVVFVCKVVPLSYDSVPGSKNFYWNSELLNNNKILSKGRFDIPDPNIVIDHIAKISVEYADALMQRLYPEEIEDDQSAKDQLKNFLKNKPYGDALMKHLYPDIPGDINDGDWEKDGDGQWIRPL